MSVRFPYRESAARGYSRLFPPAATRPDSAQEWRACADKLHALTIAMEDDGSRPNNGRPDISIDSGYTYFGQFLAHDLTSNASTLTVALTSEPEDIVNRVSPALDLDHLYGRGPDDPEDARLYTDRICLRLGKKEASGCARDLPLDDDDHPLVADVRASDNVILRQMTAVFARLHNAAVEQFRPITRDPVESFLRARLHLTWQYQRLVCEDYLPRVLHQEVYHSIFRENRPAIRWHSFSIPIEFSDAAMRFGHAMVRKEYLISTPTAKTVTQLLERPLQSGPLETDWKVDWGRFFQNASRGGPPTTAQPIDAAISPALLRIPADTLQIAHRHEKVSECPGCLSDMPANLPLVTLLRGVAMRLPSGQHVAHALHEEPLSERELSHDRGGNFSAQGEALRRADLVHATPLWYYLLKEAEVRTNGNRLGPVGSRIVGETIHAALRSDPDSYLHHAEASADLSWPDGHGLTTIHSLAGLFEYADSL